MLGFGGGCGAVGLLHQFPGIDLDAVEADPAMAAMAREFHPLVGHYERLGRLRLQIADTEDYLEHSRTTYDFVIADLIVDADSLARIDSAPLIKAVAEAAPEAWFRVFGSLPDGEIQPIMEKLAKSGPAVKWLFSPVSSAVSIPKTRDWILATGVRHPPDPDLFMPFAATRGPRVKAVQAAYRKLASGALAAY
jgi:hypothetical protein